MHDYISRNGILTALDSLECNDKAGSYSEYPTDKERSTCHGLAPNPILQQKDHDGSWEFGNRRDTEHHEGAVTQTFHVS